MASDLEFITSGTADNVSSFTLSNMFSDKYDYYQVLVTGNGSANVGSITAEFLDSSNADIAQGAYEYATYRLKPTGAFDQIRLTTANSFELVYTTAADYDFGMILNVYTPFQSDRYTFATIEASSRYAAKGVVVAKSTTSSTGMKFYANQNYTPITVTSYGVKK